VVVELFHAGRQAGRQTDMTKLIVAFRNFAKACTNSCRFVARKPEGNRPLGRVRNNFWNNIKLGLKKDTIKIKTGITWSRIRTSGKIYK
jgi:hypothetical protein